MSKYYFCGIAGCGMNPLAHLLARAGHQVAGSDLKESEELAALRQDGVACFPAQDGSRLEADQTFVYTSAIHPDNPDLVRARELGLPLLHRSELLAQLSAERNSITVAGAHGKTTVSSLIAHLLQEGGLDPAAVIGGFVPSLGGNFRCGQGPFVLEADESDGTFRRYASKTAVILNIDRDHLDFYRDLEDIEAAFQTYAGHIRPGGALIYNGADPLCRRVAERAGKDIAKISCGPGPEYDYGYAEPSYSPRSSSFTLLVAGRPALRLEVGLPGPHNVFNAVVAAAAALRAGLAPEDLPKALASFRNARRRFEFLGTWRGAAVVDDYAHHPREIAALLDSAARIGGGRTFLFQPHRFSRTEKLLEDFVAVLKDAPDLVLTDVYSAGEAKGELGGHDLYLKVLEAGGQAVWAPSPEDIPKILEERSKGWTLPHTLFFTGAGALSALAHKMISEESQSTCTNPKTRK